MAVLTRQRLLLNLFIKTFVLHKSLCNYEAQQELQL